MSLKGIFDMKKVSYKPLWKLLIDKNMKKKELIERAHLSASTINKLNHNQNVTIEILVRICSVLDCDFKDVMECVEERGEM